jgi:threonine/homoserine/homoserine lactone efflux protein
MKRVTIRTFMSKPEEARADDRDTSSGLSSAYISTLFLTITNPATIISFTIILAGLGVASTAQGGGTRFLLLLGVFLGSAAWWLILSWVVAYLREQLTFSHLVWANRLAGLALCGFGAAVLLSLIK